MLGFFVPRARSRFGGKKEKRSWWIVRKRIEYVRDCAKAVENEKFESLGCVTVIVQRLVYFEALLLDQAIDDVDGLRVLRSLVRNRIA